MDVVNSATTPSCSPIIRGPPRVEEKDGRETLQSDSKELRIKILGRKGSGKTTLVRSIFGTEVEHLRDKGDSMTPKHFLKYSGKAKGEKIIAYEQCDQSSQTLGRLASTGSLGRSQPFRHGRSLSASSLHMSSFSHREECDLVILCLPMNRVVSRFDITPLLELTEVKKDWSNAFIALTFADSLQLKTADEQFTIKLEKKVKKFKKVLQKEYTLSAHTPPHQLKIFPTAYSPDTCLPNGHEWFTSLWAAILEFASTSGQLLHMTLSGGSDRRCVLYLNEATHLDELSLQPGDIITDIQWYKEGVWALGKCQGQTGLFHPLLLQRKHPIFEELKSKEKQESRPAPFGF